MTLFWKVLEVLGGRTSVEEVGRLILFPVPSQHTHLSHLFLPSPAYPYLPTYLSAHLAACPPVCLSVHPICLSLFASCPSWGYLPTYLPAYLPAHLSVCPSHLSISICILSIMRQASPTMCHSCCYDVMPHYCRPQANRDQGYGLNQTLWDHELK